jgi:hypothetical protein
MMDLAPDGGRDVELRRRRCLGFLITSIASYYEAEQSTVNHGRVHRYPGMLAVGLMVLCNVVTALNAGADREVCEDWLLGLILGLALMIS